MLSSLKKFVILGAVAAALFCTAPAAQATLTVKLSVDGGTNFLVPTSGSLTGSGVTTATFNVGGTIFTVTGTSNAPLGVQPAQISQVQVALNNTTGTSAAFNLVVAVSDTNFTTPSGPTTLTSSLSGAIAAGAVSSTGTTNFQSVIDYNNNLFGGLPIGGVASGNTFSTGVQNFTITSSFNNTVAAATTATIPFALSNEFHVSSLTLGAGAQYTLTGTTTLAVPEPATMVAALTGLPLLGIGAWARRRKALSVAV